jgi:hypothetical protein
MTRYHVLIADELAADPDLLLPDGFRLIEPSGPGPDGWSRWWLAEDDNAPPELEQHRVEPVFTRTGHDRPLITKRHITDEHGKRRPQPTEGTTP